MSVVMVMRSDRAGGRRRRPSPSGDGLGVGWAGGDAWRGGPLTGADDAVSLEETFAWFFRAEYAHVVRTVSLVLREPTAAEDLTQEAFLRLHLHWAKVFRYDRPDAWVRRVALNLAASHARREGRRGRLERLATGAHATAREPVLADPAGLSSNGIREALLTLPHKQRALVVLYYFEDRPLSEAAELLGLTPGSAKVTLHRARARLASALDHGVATAGVDPARLQGTDHDD